MTKRRPGATHEVMIVDRSEQGLLAADDLLAVCPQVNARMGAWRASGEAFFLFIMEQESGRIGSVAAQDLEGLLSKILPELFEFALMPPAMPNFVVAASEPARQRIDQQIEHLAATASSAAGRPH